jgi:hypothetical protein
MSKTKKVPSKKAVDRRAKIKKVLKQIASQLHVIAAARGPAY